MKPYKSIFKESGEYNDPITRQFIDNLTKYNLSSKKFDQHVAYITDFNVDPVIADSVPRTDKLQELGIYVGRNQLSKINRALILDAARDFKRVLNWYAREGYDTTDINEDFEIVEKILSDFYF